MATEVKDEDITRIEDDHGNVMEYIESGGHYLSAKGVHTGNIPNPKTNFPRLKNMNLDGNDVFICAYPKSGTHWVWEILNMIVNQSAVYQVNKKGVAMYEYNVPENLEAIPKPRVFNSHLGFHLLPTQLTAKQCKIVFIQRNPKDVVTSYFYHCKSMIDFKGTFTEFVEMFMGDTMYHRVWIEYTHEWEKVIEDNTQLEIYPVMYEGIHKDPRGEIKKLAKFLGIPCDDTLADDIATKCSFQKMKQANVDIKKNIKHDHLYRKGEVGDWKNHFTVVLNEKFDKYLQKHLKDSKFTYIYEKS